MLGVTLIEGVTLFVIDGVILTEGVTLFVIDGVTLFVILGVTETVGDTLAPNDNDGVTVGVIDGLTLGVDVIEGVTDTDN
jgi:hypothetical protein